MEEIALILIFYVVPIRITLSLPLVVFFVVDVASNWIPLADRFGDYAEPASRDVLR